MKVKFAQSCLILCNPGQNTGVVSLSLLQGIFPIQGLKPGLPHLPNPGIEPGSPALRADSLPAEPRGEPEISGVRSLSLLQRIFPAQDVSLDCRRYGSTGEPGALQPKESQSIRHDPATEQLAAQWLGLWASNAGGECSIPGWGTKTSYTMQCSQKREK